MKLVVLALVTLETIAAAQPAPTTPGAPDSSEVAPPSSAPPSSAPEPEPVSEPRHSFVAVHAGIENIALHESDPEYIDPSATGFGADVEIGGRWGWGEVLGYVDFAEMSSTTSCWNVHDRFIGFGGRFRVHYRGAFGGAFLGIGTGLLTGTQSGTYVDTSTGTPTSTDAHDSFSMFSAEADAGYTFPRIGGVAPELQVILQGAVSFPPDEGPSATTTRVELGARF
jgi:hypothetical protein